jgi:hypothetical protein
MGLFFFEVNCIVVFPHFFDAFMHMHPEHVAGSPSNLCIAEWTGKDWLIHI